MSKKRTIILSAMLVLVASLVAMSTVLDWYPAVRASTIGSKQALIHGPSVSGSPSEEETWAIGAGFVVTVVTGPTWTAMPTTGPGAKDSFDDFQVLIIGDPGCFAMPDSATANFASWAPAVMGLPPSVNTLPGNRILIGTDPVGHSSQGGSELILRGIIFAGYQKDRTGVYFNMSCGNNSTGLAALTALSSTGSPAWTINNLPPCGGTVSLIATAPALTPLTSNDLQGWQCSVHETFPSFPSDWRALALATDSSLSPAVCGTDIPVCGEPYILVAGKGIVVCSLCISLSPLTATNPPGTAHKVTATVTEPGGLPQVGELITFEVFGVNENPAGTCVPVTCLTDSLGQVSFTYSDDVGCGEDFISASFLGEGEIRKASAAKEWTCPPSTATMTPTATPLATPSPTPTATPEKPCGDVNDDGLVNSLDSLLILQLEAALIATLPNLPSADVNGDGVVNSLDSNFILQFVVGFIPSLSC